MKRGTTKLDLEKWFETHPDLLKTTRGPKPYHKATAPPANVVEFPFGERYYPPAAEPEPEEEEHDIGWAVEQLCKGTFVRRAGWNGKRSFLGLQEPLEDSDYTVPCVWICTEDMCTVPWTCSQTDLLALDWEVA